MTSEHCRPRTLPIVAAAAALLVCAAAASQTTYKCKDKAGKITYAGNECHLLGLQPAGEVADRLNSAPAYKAPPRAYAPPSTPPAPAAAPEPAAAADDQTNPRRRCFTIKTAKGVATRCNDKPDEEPTPQ
jgi:hypothetical protein